MTQVHPRDERRAAYDAFLQSYPEYAETSVLDDLRTREYGRLDDLGQVYLDYTGAGLYAVSQIERHSAMLRSGIFGNPHSANPPSTASTELIESCRRRVLRFFNAPPRCLQRRLYGQREPGTEACRRSLSIRIRGPVSPHL